MMSNNFKYPIVGFDVSFNEIPDKLSLCISLGNCQNRCPGCHSPELQKKVDNLMSLDKVVEYAEEYVSKGANAICIMGGLDNGVSLPALEALIKALSDIAPVGIYHASVTDVFDNNPYLTWLKTGIYINSLGGLESKNTNQRMYQRSLIYSIQKKEGINTTLSWDDITYKFWER